MIGENGGGCDLFRFDQVQSPEFFVGFMVVNIDIRLPEILKNLPHSFEVCTIHGDECIVFPIRAFEDRVHFPPNV